MTGSGRARRVCRTFGKCCCSFRLPCCHCRHPGTPSARRRDPDPAPGNALHPTTSGPPSGRARPSSPRTNRSGPAGDRPTNGGPGRPCGPCRPSASVSASVPSHDPSLRSVATPSPALPAFAGSRGPPSSDIRTGCGPGWRCASETAEPSCGPNPASGGPSPGSSTTPCRDALACRIPSSKISNHRARVDRSAYMY